MKKIIRWVVRWCFLSIPMILCICLEYGTEWLFEKVGNAWEWTFDD